MTRSCKPPPGVSAFEHLVSGLVPTLCLLAAAAVFRRAGAGCRAAIAAVVGIGGLVSGVELFVALSRGMSAVSADDYTGGLSVLPGFVLLVTATSIAWRHRNRAGKIGRRVAGRAVIALLGVMTVFLLVFPVALAYVSTHTVGVGIVAPPTVGVPVAKVGLTTSDGLKLPPGPCAKPWRPRQAFVLSSLSSARSAQLPS